MFEKLKERYRTSGIIRRAIDTYPGGICFTAADGRPILANKKINEICYALTGHTVTNGEGMWEELQQKKLRPETAPCEELQEDCRTVLCRLADDTVWQFRRLPFSADGQEIIQYEASEITELYEYRARLAQENAQAALLHERQRELMKNIVQNNLDKELLAAKVRIHDDFGQLLLVTENMLADTDHTQDAQSEQELLASWRNVIEDMENAAETSAKRNADPRDELVKVAEMTGCKVNFSGTQPHERRALLLMYAAVREALTNAVRHGGADGLTVEMSETPDSYRIRITNNGTAPAGPVREGVGLGSLRRRLEQEGAALTYTYADGFAVLLQIPKEG